MSCSTALAGLAKDCVANQGGIRNLYIGLFGALVPTITSGKITAAALATGAAKFKKYAFSGKSANVQSTPQFNDLGDYAGETTTLNVQFSRQDTAKRVEINAISVNELAVVYEDNNGKLWLIGKDHPVRRTGGDAVSGSAAADTNAYGLTLTDESNELPYEIDSTAWTSALWE